MSSTMVAVRPGLNARGMDLRRGHDSLPDRGLQLRVPARSSRVKTIVQTGRRRRGAQRQVQRQLLAAVVLANDLTVPGSNSNDACARTAIPSRRPIPSGGVKPGTLPGERTCDSARTTMQPQAKIRSSIVIKPVGSDHSVFPEDLAGRRQCRGGICCISPTTKKIAFTFRRAESRQSRLRRTTIAHTVVDHYVAGRGRWRRGSKQLTLPGGESTAADGKPVNAGVGAGLLLPDDRRARRGKRSSTRRDRPSRSTFRATRAR